MFGIMKPQKSCSIAGSTAYYQRQHYCGTCKAIGQAYGQRSRLLLNFDGVFLAELLTQLHNMEVQNWEPRLQRPNTCFNMPKEEAPFSLRYAGAATLLFSALSLEDQLVDRPDMSWRFAQRLYQTPFQKAVADLSEWGVNTTYVYNQAEQQRQLEREAARQDDLLEQLNHYSEPTSQLTAHVFSKAGATPAQTTALERLGQTFGRLLYVLDAFEDYEKDVFRGEFNPLALYWGETRTLTEEQLNQVRNYLLESAQQIGEALAALPLEADFVATQQARLESNLALRLYTDRMIPSTWTERLAQRYRLAKITAHQWLCHRQAPWRQLQYYIVVLAVFISPQTKHYLPQDGKVETVGWMTFTIALLAGLGWVRGKRYDKRKERKEKRKKRQARRWWKRWTRRSKQKPSGAKNAACGQCAGDCLGACCQGCANSGGCDGCCDSCCQDCCQTCCDWIAETEYPWLTVMLLIFGFLFLVGIIVLLVLLT